MLLFLLHTYGYKSRSYDNFFTWEDKLSREIEIWQNVGTNCLDIDLLMLYNVGNVSHLRA